MASRKRDEQHERTHRALLDTAQVRFSSSGYSAVTLSAVAAGAGVTKGALYHHFPSGKTALFAAVLEEVQAHVAEGVAAAAAEHSDPWDQFQAGCDAFLSAATDPVAQRVMLLDGPVVLGWDRWREIDERNSFRHLTEGLERLIASEAIAPQPVDALARLLTGAMNEAALWIARDPTATRARQARTALHSLLRPLRR